MKHKITLADKLLRILFLPDLSPYDRAVHQYLVWRQGEHKTTWPGIRTIAKELHIDPSTVQLCINKLVRLGYLSRYRVRIGKSFNNVYITHLVHVRGNPTSAYGETVQNFKQLTRDDPALEEPVVQKAGAKRETPGEKAMRKLLQEHTTRRELRNQAERKAEQQKIQDQPDKEVNHGTK